MGSFPLELLPASVLKNGGTPYGSSWDMLGNDQYSSDDNVLLLSMKNGVLPPDLKFLYSNAEDVLDNNDEEQPDKYAGRI
jgi:hypothetical protein